MQSEEVQKISHTNFVHLIFLFQNVNFILKLKTYLMVISQIKFFFFLNLMNRFPRKSWEKLNCILWFVKNLLLRIWNFYFLLYDCNIKLLNLINNPYLLGRGFSKTKTFQIPSFWTIYLTLICCPHCSVINRRS